MKKIIALAVASAFAAPLYAADVTLSGDLEIRFHQGEDDGLSSTTDDGDIVVTATEQVGDLTIKAVISAEDLQDAADGDVELHVSGGFGTIAVGDVDNAAATIDEMADVAEANGGTEQVSLATAESIAVQTVRWTLPEIVPGLVAHVSMGFEAGTADTSSANELDTTSYGARYSVGGVTIGAGVLEVEDAAYDPTYTAISYGNGPLYVAYASTKDDGAANTDTSTIAATYNYGPGKVYAEMNEQKVAAGTTTDIDVVGISYQIGGMNLYLEQMSHSTASSGAMTAGVEYSF